jgi:hypothetical protein
MSKGHFCPKIPKGSDLYLLSFSRFYLDVLGMKSVIFHFLIISFSQYKCFGYALELIFLI